MIGRKRRNSQLVEVSNRSNGLAFSHHHFLPFSSLASKQAHGSILSPINSNVPTSTRGKLSPSLAPGSKPSKKGIVAIGQTVRSLIPPATLELETIHHRQKLSSISTVNTSDFPGKQESTIAPAPNMATMPAEILEMIFQHLPQLDLHSLMVTNTNFSEVAATYLYDDPKFASTYRFAQFNNTVSQKPHYAYMVHYLDLSRFPKELDSLGELIPLAGWREWKYKNGDINSVHHHTKPTNPKQKFNSYQTITTSHKAIKTINKCTRSHPPPSPMLKIFDKTRDLPIGGVCSVLAACPNLREVNLSCLQLAADFLVLPPGHQKPAPLPHEQRTLSSNAVNNLSFITNPALWPSLLSPSTSSSTASPPELISSGTNPLPPFSPSSSKPKHLLDSKLPPSPLLPLTFVSTLPDTRNWHADNIAPLYADEIIFWLTQLPLLQSLKISYCVWLSSARVTYLMKNAGRALEKVDFRESGMQQALRWAIEGTREEVRDIVDS